MQVAELDLLRDRDLLSGSQQRMPAGLAQEELERVGRRLGRRLRRERDRLRQRLTVLDDVVDYLDAALLELAVDAVGLERVERERLEHLVELGLAQPAGLLDRVDQPLQLDAEEQDVYLDRHPASSLPVWNRVKRPAAFRQPPARESVKASIRIRRRLGRLHVSYAKMGSGAFNLGDSPDAVRSHRS